MRSTLAKRVKISGTGLHSGAEVTMSIEPAAAGHGIVFRRADIAGEAGIVPARYDLVTDTQLCTKLSNGKGASIGTVEHVMAALAGCGITDALITVDGPEVPIMDGSSAPFIAALAKAGIRTLGVPCRAIRILAPVREADGERVAELLPAERFEMSFEIRFDDPAIGHQRESMVFVNGTFVHELGNCRTFGHLREVEQLRAMGLARGGGLQNAIVVDKGRVLNPEGLRRPDEFVRHKMLDAVGDLALAGAPIIGRYNGVKSGHEMTNRLLHRLFATPEAWTWDTLTPSMCLGGPDLELAPDDAPVALAV